jgi:hypothetical protein
MSNHSSVSSMASELEGMPERVEDARKVLKGWRGRAVGMMKESPGRALLGAFAIGFVVAKVGRFL